MAHDRIDVHTHLIPPFYAEQLKSHGGDPSGWSYPEWSPAQALSFMDDEEIAVAMLSLTAPGIEGWSELKKKIEHALVRSAELDAKNITVEIQGSKAILKGTVRAWAEREEAERAVWSAPGIAAVENQITIEA